MTEETIYFSGVDAATGEYLQEPLSDTKLARILAEESSWRAPAEERELKWWDQKYAIDDPLRSPARGVNPKDLSSSGWAILFSENTSEGVRRELAPLIKHRQAQAAARHENYFRKLKYIPGESKSAFFDRLKIEHGPAKPEHLPYYILIVGGPTTVPYRFQYLLDMQYAVGRLSFDTPEEYGRYADSVIRCEQGKSEVSSDLALFTAYHEGDKSLSRLRHGLTEPIRQALCEPAGKRQLQMFGEGQKDDLLHLLGGSTTPAFLFTAAHGLSFSSGNPRQEAKQGAILCQDWPGRGTTPRSEHYVSAEDISDEARLLGLIAFHFGCFSAGTPESTNYPTKAMTNPPRHAPKPLVSSLAKKLLSHRNGGALAVLGHVDRIWSSSFGSGRGKGHYHFESFLKDILNGHPIGSAMDWLNERFAEISTELTDGLEETTMPGRSGDNLPSERARIARLWRANNDARNFILLGDPAVRLVTATPGGRVGPARAQATQPTQIYKLLKSRSVTQPSKPAAAAILNEKLRTNIVSDTAVVIDSSALVELLLRTPASDRIEAEIRSATVHVPHFIDIEVAQALYHYQSTQEVSLDRVKQAISDFSCLPMTRHSHNSILLRIVELQDEMPASEAAYIALAEALSAKLLTCSPELESFAKRRVAVKLIR